MITSQFEQSETTPHLLFLIIDSTNVHTLVNYYFFNSFHSVRFKELKPAVVIHGWLHSVTVFSALTYVIVFIAVIGAELLLCNWITEPLHDHAQNLNQ